MPHSTLKVLGLQLTTIISSSHHLPSEQHAGYRYRWRPDGQESGRGACGLQGTLWTSKSSVLFSVMIVAR